MQDLIKCSCCGRHIRAKNSRRIRLKLNNYDILNSTLFEGHYDLCPDCEKELRKKLDKINRETSKY